MQRDENTVGTDTTPDAILRLPEVTRRVGISSAQVYKLIRRNLFPRPFPTHPGARSKGWLERDIDAWIHEQAKGAY